MPVHHTAAGQRGPARQEPPHVAAPLLFVLSVTLLGLTSHNIGLTWDEPISITAGESYADWTVDIFAHPGRALTGAEISTYWTINHEHPPIDKLWSGLVWMAAHPFVDDLTAHRLGNILLSGVLVAVIYLIVAEASGALPGLVAAIATLTMPRLFFHEHLASLDVPAAVAVVVLCYLFWRTVDRPGLRWGVLLGVAYGLAMGMKVTAMAEIPLILVPWALVFRRRGFVLTRLVLMLGVGVVVCVLLWPWLYVDPLERVGMYVSFMTLGHYPIEQWYLFRLYAPPPWHYPLVITLAVVPLTITMLAFLGSLVVVRDRNPIGWLLILGGAVPMALLVIGRSQIYDGERLWMPTFPFIAALAGIGFGRITAEARQRGGRRAGLFVALVTAATFAPQAARAVALYPHELSYYSEAVGGLRGATRLGLETTYWAETYEDAVPYLNAHAPAGATVWVEAHDVMLLYQREGLLRPDLRIASLHGDEGIVPGEQGVTLPVGDADFVVVENRQSGFFGELTRWLRDRTPASQVTVDDVPLLGIYSR